ncbi:mannitol dehydrogenase family protein [Marinomonas balearica]|uniref:Tagaturonate reductase n=1 Tax=Marinomonas balearica TaxID=491947 RepID=A0A4R6M6Z4_9GAMM|nr:mannitol dehydrogenase family protein [Marinomonas balearica]TDO95839.1 tagaturonate reductase [Marinomonas balearica]
MQKDFESPNLIMQFGTSRFLQAHVDFFVGESIAQGLSTSKIAVIQSSNSPAGKQRMTAFSACSSYPVKVQGMQNGHIVDHTHQVNSIEMALQANEDWQTIKTLFCQRVSHVISNTADQGFQLNVEDNADLLTENCAPKSFPAKLLVLLKARFDFNQQGIVIMPCELVVDNGEVLKDLVLGLAKDWQLSEEFVSWLQNSCCWVNSLVDRIVSQAIDPIGAVAEPYALWAIEKKPHLKLPCQHNAIKLVDSLKDIEFLKLGVLNLSHTYLVDLWKKGELNGESLKDITTVREAMEHEGLRTELESLLAHEVIPILSAANLSEDVESYVESVRERFLNPFLQHQLSDIADNHHAKIERRIVPIFQKGLDVLPAKAFPKLSACLSANGLYPNTETSLL